MPKKVYLDESGDLGWKFDLPYRNGGSSRYLTIAYIVIPQNKHVVINRFVKNIYQHFSINRVTEFKASTMDASTKKYVAEKILDLINSNPDFILGAISVSKERVMQHLRADSNKLYNYMIAQSVLAHIATSPQVALIRDNRSVKVKSGNSCIDYLQIKLWYEIGTTTILRDHPSESHTCNGLIFIDWVTNFIWCHYEDKNSDCFLTLSPIIRNQRLFF